VHCVRFVDRFSLGGNFSAGYVDESAGHRVLIISLPEGRVRIHGVYREIAAPDRLVFTEIYDPFPDVESVVTQVLTEEKGKTRLTVTGLYRSLEVRDAVLETGMARGAGISCDRLEDLVRELPMRMRISCVASRASSGCQSIRSARL
jgi:Activator of Hsp90 ATPase homolog 1-like protein